MKLNEADLKRLKKVKSSFPASVAEELHAVICEFAQCSRADFFEGISLTEFVKVRGAAGKALAEYTFGGICQMGAVGVCELPGVGQSAVKEIVAVLHNFCSETDCTDQSDRDTGAAALEVDEGKDDLFSQELPAALKTIEPVVSAESATQPLDCEDIPVYSSVAAEKQIAASFAKLKQSPHYDGCKERLLKDFWDADLIRAPFIEAMTIRELVSIPVSDLLKKRSFGNRKIHGLITAMDNCLTGFSSEAGCAENIAVQQSTRSAAASKLINIDEIWGELPPTIGDPVKMILYELSFFSSTSDEASNALQRVAQKLPEVADAVCILGAMLGTEYSSETVCRILRVTSWDLMAREKYFPEIMKVVREECSDMLAVWEPLLQSAGVSEAKLFDGRLEAAYSQEVQRMLCRMILKLMDAKNPEYSAKRLENYWTTNVKAFGRQLESILVIMPVPDDNLKEDLKTLFPEIQQDVLIELMKQIAVYNEESKFWRRR